MKELNKIQKKFIWKNKPPPPPPPPPKKKKKKKKHTTLCNNCNNGSLKNVDISSKIPTLQCSWIKKLNDNTTPSYI